MKGLCVFAFLLLIIMPLFQVQQGDFLSKCNAEEVYFVKNRNGKQCYEKQETKDFSIVDFAKTEGVILKYSTGQKDKILEDFGVKVIKKEQIENRDIIYGYTKFYSDFIYIKNKQSNIQIAESEDCIIVGFPIIYSGF